MSENLPDNVNDNMIDEYFGYTAKQEERLFEYPEGGCDQNYSLGVLSEFIKECKECGGCSDSEYEDLSEHIENIKRKRGGFDGTYNSMAM